jgi:restriction endonuclease S subunit
VEWREFFIGGKEGLFNIRSTNSGIDKNKLLENTGDIPYVTRSNLNNGIDMFVGEKQNNGFSIDKGNVITIGLDTQTVFYQPKNFFSGQNIQIAENEFLNKEIALFLVPLLKIQMRKFSWGSTGATLTRLNRTKILLPVDSSGNPDWELMENFIKQEQKAQTQKIVSYYKQRIIEACLELLDLENVERKESYSAELFEKNRSNQTRIGAYKDGDIHLVSAKKVGSRNKALVSGNSEIDNIYKLAVSLGQSKYSLESKNIQWKEFWLEDIVDIRSSVRLTKAEQKPGKRPFIGSTDGNNGVTNFVSNINNSLDSNLLGVNYNGSVVDNFYHPYECIFSDDVKRLHFKDKSARNKYCYLFLKQCILKQKSKYAYGYKFNAARMKRQKIMLPVNSGKIYYDFMRKYMVIQEIKELYKVVKYLNIIF